jgi:hypothetical protein
MSTQVQWKRGTTAQNNTYTGAIGEITVDTSLKQLRLHDGTTPGGTAIQGTTVSVSSATNLAGGSASQIPYQTGPNVTSFFGPGTAGTVLVSYGSAGIPTFQNTLTLAGTAAATSTQTGALVVGGGVGIGGNLYVGGDIVANKLTIQLTTVTTTLVTTDDIISTYNTTQSNSTTTGALQVAGGAGIGLDITVGGSIRVASVVTATTFIGNLTGNITGNGTGNLHYQSANNTTSFLSTGTTGQLLVAAGGAPTWTNTTSIQVGYAANILGLGTGGILYESANNTTSILSTATTGNFLQANYNGAPTWTGTGSMYVYRATIADSASGGANTATNLFGGNAWQIPYQSAPSTTLFANSGTTGQFWQAATNGAPTWTSTSSIYVNSAVSAEKLYAGTAGQIVYQSAASTTAFLGTATTGNFLQANYVGAPTWTTTASMYVNSAVYAQNIYAGTTGQLVYQSGISTTGFVGPGSYGQFLMSTGAGAPVYQSTLTQANGNIIITSNTAATSTATGALQIVNGGLGVGGDIWAGNIFTGPAQYIYFGGQTGTRIFRDGGQNGMSLQTANISRLFIADNTGIVTVTTGSSVSSTNTGALQVAGGLGVGGGGFFGGIVTATTYYGTFAGTIGGSTTISTASNIANGTAGQILYQSAVGTTGFVNTATTGNFLQANYVGAPTWTTTASMYVNDAVKSTNLRAGTAGQLHYQSAADTSGFISTATTGNFLQANYVGAPTWTTTASMYVNSAVASEKLYAGTAGQLVYQSAASTTAFLGTATTGNFLQANYVGAPTWTTTASMYVANAVTATNLRAGTAGQLHYQSAVDTSGFISTATTGNFLQANYVGAPTWTTTASMYVANAVTATNLRAGTAGQLVYQSAVDTSGFISTATTGNFLQANYAGAPTWTSTGTMYVNRAVIADSASGGSAQVNTVAQTANANYFPAFVSTNNASAAAMSVYTTSSVYINPSTGAINATTHIAIDSTLLPNASAGVQVQNGSTSMNFVAYAGGGNYNPTTQAGDSLIYWRGVGQGNAGGLNIAPWSTTATGIRIALNGVTTIASTVSTFSTTTGALVVNGGVGIAGGLVVGGTVTATNMILNGYQVSTSSALTIQGYGTSLGTASTLNFSTGTTATVVGGVATIQALGSVSSVTGGTDTVATSVSGAVTVWNTSTLQSITNRGATTTNIINITNATAGSSTLTGALVVTGGIGLGGNFYSAGNVVIQNNTQANSTTSGALQIVNGGMGIGGNAYIGGSLYTNGAKVLPTNIQEFSATGGQTTFTITGGYTVGTVQVFANGVALGSTDFTASNGTTVVVNTARNVGDVIRTVTGITSTSINNIQSLSLAYAVAFG